MEMIRDTADPKRTFKESRMMWRSGSQPFAMRFQPRRTSELKRSTCATMRKVAGGEAD
jgi:hypothetical protein